MCPVKFETAQSPTLRPKARLLTPSDIRRMGEEAKAAQAAMQALPPPRDASATTFVNFSEVAVGTSVDIDGQKFNIRFFKVVGGKVVYAPPSEDQKQKLAALLKTTIEKEKAKDPTLPALSAIKKVVIQWPLDKDGKLDTSNDAEVLITNGAGVESKYDIGYASDFARFMRENKFDMMIFTPGADEAKSIDDATAVDRAGSPNTGTDCFFNAAVRMLAGSQLHEHLQTHNDNGRFTALLTVLDKARNGSEIYSDENTAARESVKSLLAISLRYDISGQSDPSVVFEALAEALGDKYLGKDLITTTHSCQKLTIPQEINSFGHYVLPITKQSDLKTLIEDYQKDEPKGFHHNCGIAGCTITHHTKFADLNDFVFTVKLAQLHGVERRKIVADASLKINGKDYDLVGYTIHSGEKTGGHYIACIKVMDQGVPEYYIYNDDKVKTLTYDKFLEGAKGAYQYHYQKRFNYDVGPHG